MAAPEFLFALELSDESRFETMLSDLAHAVLAYVGYQKAAADELCRVVKTAVIEGISRGHRRWRIKFRARGGELEIAVSYGGGGEWRTVKPLPEHQ